MRKLIIMVLVISSSLYALDFGKTKQEIIELLGEPTTVAGNIFVYTAEVMGIPTISYYVFDNDVLTAKLMDIPVIVVTRFIEQMNIMCGLPKIATEEGIMWMTTTMNYLLVANNGVYRMMYTLN